MFIWQQLIIFLPSIDAAFVNVGTDRMGFLHAEDIMGKGTLKENFHQNKN